MKVRPFRPDDLDAVHRVIQGTIDAKYPGAYPPRAVAFFKKLHSPDGILKRHDTGSVVVAEAGDLVVGTGSLTDGEIGGVFVLPEFQGLGIGAQLMSDLEGQARQLGLPRTRLSVSLPSRGFYERLGYGSFVERSLDVGGGESLDYWEAEKSLGGEP